MTQYVFINNFSFELGHALSDTDTVIEAASFPGLSDWLDWKMRLTIASGNDLEIVEVTGGNLYSSPKSLTIVRGAEGTTPLAWSIGATVESRITAGILRDIANISVVTGSALAPPDNPGGDSITLSVTDGYESSRGYANGAAAIAIGYEPQASGTNSIAIGRSAKALDFSSIALGRGFAPLPRTLSIGDVYPIAQNGSGDLYGTDLITQEIVVLSDFISLTTAGTALWTTQFPNGSRFFCDSFGIIISLNGETITVDPQVSFGIHGGSSTALLAATTITDTNTHDRTEFPCAIKPGHENLTFSITSAATATSTVFCRVFWKGFLVQSY